MKECKHCIYARGSNHRCWYRLITNTLHVKKNGTTMKQVLKQTGRCLVRRA